MAKNLQKNWNKATGIGLMSGTSLDGIDIIACTFPENNFEIKHFASIEFDSSLKNRLANAHDLSGEKLYHLENEFTSWCGARILEFVQSKSIQADYIGAHGHTVFHQPHAGLTVQILNGGKLAVETGIDVVCDFRRQDVALQGQGAPLVPIGDELLFKSYSACLNLGGFANVSFSENGHRIAYDICPVNIVLNALANKLGQDFDKDGLTARNGKINNSVLEALNRLPFYSRKPPKSLGREWVESEIISFYDKDSPENLLRTMVEHIAIQIAQNLPSKGEVLVTGGGAFNHFLIEKLKSITSAKISIPERELIEGKEALIFAFLAHLRLKHEENVLKTVTGAERNSCSGAVYLS